MGVQSIIMGEAFGKGFQFGKRKISALTNEQFNKLSLAELWKDTSTDVSEMIPSLKAGMTESRELQSFIVKELIAVVKQIPKDIIEGVVGEGAAQIPQILNPTQGLPESIFKIIQAIAEKGINLNLTGGNLLPQAFAETPPGGSGTPDIPLESPPGPNLDNPIEDALQRQQEHRGSKLTQHKNKWDAKQREELTITANVVNTASATINPPARRITQSTKLQLTKLIQAQNIKLNQTIGFLNLIKKSDTADHSRTIASWTKLHILYRKLSLAIVTFIKTYRI